MSAHAPLLLQSPLLSQIPGLSHGFSTRLCGTQKYGADNQASVWRNRQQLFEALALDPTQVVACQQTHSAHVVSVSKKEAGRGAHQHEAGIPDCDGLLTQETGIPLLIMVADCYPVLLADPISHIIAAVHAGWRGVQQEILKIALMQMQSNGAQAGNIRVAIGPGIGFSRFEVGPEVIHAFGSTLDSADRELCMPQGEKYRLNLAEMLRRQALETGLNPQHIDVIGACTLSENARFFSFRGEAGQTGRQVGLIGWMS